MAHRQRFIVAGLIAVAVLAGALNGVELAGAQQAIRIRSDEVQVRFPYVMNFSFESESSAAAISDIRLMWQAGPGSAFNVTLMNFHPARMVSIQYPLNVQFLQLPPFAQIAYRWEVRDSDGNFYVTETRTVEYGDSRVEWEILENERIRMLWYGHSEEFAEELFALADGAYMRLAEQFGVTLDNKPSIVVYPDRQAFSEVQGMLGNVEFVIGRYYPGHNITVNLITVDMPRQLYGETLAHELSHLYSDNYYVGYARLPLWLEEGLATYNESEDLSEELHTVRMAAGRELLIPFIELGDAIRDRNITITNLAYAEGATIFAYTHEQWGQAKVVEFLAAFRTTTSVDEVMRRVFGLTMAEFEIAWRAWLGYPVAQVPQLAPTATLRPFIFPTPTYIVPGG